jgi:outer membrane protein TolC
MTFPAGSFGAPQETTIQAPRALSAHVSATVAQPLSQLHRIGLGTQLSRAALDAERAKAREERAAVASEVRKLYYAILQTESVLAATEEQLRVYRELDRVVEQHVVIEASLRSEAMEVKARLAGEEHRLLTLGNDLAGARERLNHLLGRDVDTAFATERVPESSLEEANLSAAMAHALERRPDLALARLAVTQSDLERRIKKAESIPEVSLAVTYTTFVNVDLVPKNLAQAGLQVKWTPFDWGKRGHEKAEKALAVQQARAGEREAESAARLEVAQHFRKLQQARSLLAAQDLSLSAHREKLRVVQARHRAEAALLKDVLEMQAATIAAHADRDRALLDYWTARADFQHAIGEEL